MPYQNPKLAALTRAARHRRAPKAGYFILKIQRPIRSNEDSAPWLYTTEDERFYELLPFDAAVANLMGEKLKVYVYARLVPDPEDSSKQKFEIFEGVTVPEEFTDW